MTIVVDLDGTLITARERQSLLLKAVAARYEIELFPEQIWSMKREGASNVFLLHKLGVKQDLIARIASAWKHEIESPYWLDMDSLFVDVRSCLHKLSVAGFEVCVLTARKNEYLLRYQLFKLGIVGRVSRVMCVDPFEAEKRKSDILLEMRPFCMVGDSETDCRAAASAGVKFYGVATGQRSERYLHSAGVRDVSRSLTEAVGKILVS
jgi:phosphoglycolate phosphatase-like HAD superfamily hydrolase